MNISIIKKAYRIQAVLLKLFLIPLEFPDSVLKYIVLF
jgi:hypothetical protein